MWGGSAHFLNYLNGHRKKQYKTNYINYLPVEELIWFRNKSYKIFFFLHNTYNFKDNASEMIRHFDSISSTGFVVFN